MAAAVVKTLVVEARISGASGRTDINGCASPMRWTATAHSPERTAPRREAATSRSRSVGWAAALDGEAAAVTAVTLQAMERAVTTV